MSYILKEKNPFDGGDDYFVGGFRTWSKYLEDALRFETKEEAQLTADLYRSTHDGEYVRQHGEASQVRIVRLVKKGN